MGNIRAYLEGTVRYYLYNSWWAWLIRTHIYEQIQLRIQVMDKICYNSGSCKLCGCSTTALQMAQRACDKPCYPQMMTRREWRTFKDLKVHMNSNKIWLYKNENKIESYKLEDYVGKPNY